MQCCRAKTPGGLFLFHRCDFPAAVILSELDNAEILLASFRTVQT